MSPIDDELRAALRGRAQVLAPSPDPLAGIERRARRLQRQRIGAAVAGSVLAVGLVAAVVPVIQTSTSSQREIPRLAESQGPDRPSPAPQDGRPAAALDWGSPLDQQLDQAYLAEWEALNGKPAGATTGEVLYRGETADGVQVHVYQLWFDAQTAYAVVGHSSEAGPEIVRGTILEPGTLVVDAVVEGEELPALVIAHDPALPTVQYAADGRTFTTIVDAEGSGVITPRTGGTGPEPDRIRLLDQRKQVVYDEPVSVSDDGSSGDDSGTGLALDPAQPWEVRGDRSLVTDGQLEALGEDWAQRHGVDPAQVALTPLHVQAYEPAATVEVVYLVRFKDNPWMWGVSSLGEGGWSWYAEDELSDGTTALAAALPGDEGRQRLLVVGAPSLGGAVYAADGRRFTPMTDLEPGVFVTAIAAGDADDRLKVLDGNGDLDDPVFEGPAPDLQSAG